MSLSFFLFFSLFSLPLFLSLRAIRGHCRRTPVVGHAPTPLAASCHALSRPPSRRYDAVRLYRSAIGSTARSQPRLEHRRYKTPASRPESHTACPTATMHAAIVGHRDIVLSVAAAELRPRDSSRTPRGPAITTHRLPTASCCLASGRHPLSHWIRR